MNYIPAINKTVDTVIEEFRKVGDIYGILLYGSAAKLYKQTDTGKLQRRPKDIDLLLVLNFPFLIPRHAYEQVAESAKKARKLSDFPLELTVCDKELPRTRFTTFGPLSVKKHFQHSRPIFGEDIRKLFSGAYFIAANKFPVTEEEFENKVRPESEARGYMAWNLKNARKGAIDYKYNARYDRKDFERNIEYSVGSMMNFIRSAVLLKKGNWYEEYEELLKAARQEFKLSDPEIETDEDNLKGLDFDSKVNAYFCSVKAREEIVQDLCKKKPVELDEKLKRALGMKK